MSTTTMWGRLTAVSFALFLPALAAAQAAPTPEKVKEVFGSALKDYSAASGRLAFKLEFDQPDDLRFFDLKLLERTGGTATTQAGAMVVGCKAKGGAHEVFLGLLELHFQKAMTVRLTLESYDATKVATAVVVFASEDWIGGYKCAPGSGTSASLSLLRTDLTKAVTTLGTKMAPVETGDRLELSTGVAGGVVSVSLKGRKTRSLTLDAKDPTYTSGRALLRFLVEGQNTQRIAAAEFEGFVSPASLQRLFDVLALRTEERTAAEEKKKQDGESDEDGGRKPRILGRHDPMKEELPPGFSLDWSNLGKIPEKSREDFLRAMIELGPKERVDALRTIVKRHPRFVLGYQLAALAAEQVGDFRAARQLLDQALEVDDQSVETHLMLSFLGFMDRDLELLHQHAEAALRVEADCARAFALRARGHLGRNDRKSAEADANKALDNAPDLWARRESERVLSVCKGPKWLRGPFTARTDHYEVLSEVSEAFSAQIARKLELAYALFQKRFKALPAGHDPGRVLVFQTKEAYLQYAKDSMGGDLTFTLGVFVPWSREFLLFCREENKETLETLVHEGYHQYLHNLVQKAPHWFNEGMASYFESVDMAGGESGIGVPVKIRVDWLNSGRFIAEDLADLMKLSPAEFMNRQRVSDHYAQSWALCHFLRHGPTLGRQTFQQYTDQVVQGATREEAFERSFGKLAAKDWGELKSAFTAHVDKLKKGRR